MEKLRKALDERLEKAKYTKRTGSPGKYKYEYGSLKGKRKKVEQEMGRKKKLEFDIDSESVRESIISKIQNKLEDPDDYELAVSIFDEMDEKKAKKIYYGKEKPSGKKSNGKDKVDWIAAEKTSKKMQKEKKDRQTKGGSIPKEFKSIIKEINDLGENAAITSDGKMITELGGTGNEWYLNRITPQKNGKFLFESFEFTVNNPEDVNKQDKLIESKESKKTFSSEMTKDMVVNQLNDDHQLINEDDNL